MVQTGGRSKRDAALAQPLTFALGILLGAKSQLGDWSQHFDAA